jgi:hypothetical protein
MVFNKVLNSLPGLNYEIEASTDLVNWVIITNFMTTNSPYFFGDPQAKNYQQRFYRASDTVSEHDYERQQRV